MDYDFSKISTKELKYACKFYEEKDGSACANIACSDCPFGKYSPHHRDCGDGRVSDEREYKEFKKELNRRLGQQPTSDTPTPDFSSISTEDLRKGYKYYCGHSSCLPSSCIFKAVDKTLACGGFEDEEEKEEMFKAELNRRMEKEKTGSAKVTTIKVGPDFSSLSTTELKEWKWNARFTCQRTEDKCNAHDCVFKAVDPSKACGGFCDQKHELIEAEIKRREDWEKGVERRYSDPIGIPQGLMVSSPFPTKESFSMKNCVVNQSTPDIIAVDYEEEEEVALVKW